jgi:hypothetical protein
LSRGDSRNAESRTLRKVRNKEDFAMNDGTGDDYLPPRAAARLIPGEPSEAGLRNWRKAGIGPAFHEIGGRVFYKTEDVRQWVASARVAPSQRRAG